MMQGWWRQIRQFPWLSVGWLTIGCAILAICFLLWVSLQLAQRMTVELTDTSADTASADQVVVLPDRLDGELGMLFEAVPAPDLSKPVAVVGQRAPEFRGTEFIKANASNWTLQVMKVSQESVVKTYLAQRKDRQRFQYFRMVEGAQEYYLLTYGNFTTVQTAMGALQTMQFELPRSVKAFPERFSTYQPSVKDQGSEERMSGLSQKVRQIVLKPVAIPVEVELAAAVQAQRPDLGEPAFGALAGDQVAIQTNPVIAPSTETSSDPAATRPPATQQPAESGVVPRAPASATPVQDPFN